MTWVDLAILVVVGISVVLAFMRGFVREALGILAWGGAGYFSYIAIGFVRSPVRDLIGNPEMADIVSHAGLFLIALIVLSLATSVVAQIIHGLGLGALDRTLGIVFGLARGALLTIAAYIGAGWVTVPERWPPPVREARLLPLVSDGATRLVEYIPERFRPSVPIAPPMPATRSLDLLQAVPLGRQPPKP